MWSFNEIIVSENIIGKVEGENPFEKINDLYSKILGERTEIFEPIDGMIDTGKRSEVSDKKRISGKKDTAGGNVCVYGAR